MHPIAGRLLNLLLSSTLRHEITGVFAHCIVHASPHRTSIGWECEAFCDTRYERNRTGIPLAHERNRGRQPLSTYATGDGSLCLRTQPGTAAFVYERNRTGIPLAYERNRRRQPLSTNATGDGSLCVRTQPGTTAFAYERNRTVTHCLRIASHRNTHSRCTAV